MSESSTRRALGPEVGIGEEPDDFTADPPSAAEGRSPDRCNHRRGSLAGTERCSERGTGAPRGSSAGDSAPADTGRESSSRAERHLHDNEAYVWLLENGLASEFSGCLRDPYEVDASWS